MSRQSRELKKQQERAKKYGCDGRCYWSTGMRPSVEICDETRVGEAIATAIGLITVLAMIAMIPIIVIGGAIMLIWSIFHTFRGADRSDSNPGRNQSHGWRGVLHDR